MVRAGVWRVERVDRSCIHNNRGAVAICDRVVCVWNATRMRGLDCGGAFIRARGSVVKNQRIYRVFMPNAGVLGIDGVAARRCGVDVFVLDHVSFWHGRCHGGRRGQRWICGALGIGTGPRNAFIKHGLRSAPSCGVGAL